MTDTTVNQTADVNPNVAAGASAAAPVAAKPDVDDLFGKPDVDELFPQGPDLTQHQMVRNVSPIQDMLFSDPGGAHAHARILDAFGYGFKQDWGAGQQEFSEADDWMRKSGMWNDYAKGQHSIIKAANEAVMRPAVAAIIAGIASLPGLFHGGQAAVAQTGEEYGAPQLGRELAAIPEAFPVGMEPAGIAGAAHLREAIAQAKSLGVIGAGEAGYFGTKPVEPTPAVESADAAKTQDIAKPQAVTGKDAEAPPSPVVQPVAPAAAEQSAPDIHAVARQIAPQTFEEFDALAQKKDTFRRWISELQEVRDQTAAENAPHADAIADLNAQIAAQQAKKGGYGKLQSLIGKRDDLMTERDAYIVEHTQGDSADMAKVRQQLMQADYRMRDLAPDVSAAYRQAAERMPGAETVEPATGTEANAAPVEEAPVANASEAQPALGASAPEAGAEVSPAVAAAQGAIKPTGAPAAAPKVIPATEIAAPPAPAAPGVLPIAHAPSIVADVEQKLIAAGRPAEEAEAAAQVVAAYWETRAARFEGRKGTAAEMYAREAPEIVAGKEKAKPRELELAQRDREVHNSKNAPEERDGKAGHASEEKATLPLQEGRDVNASGAGAASPGGEGDTGGSAEGVGKEEGGQVLNQSRVDRGGRSVPVTAVDPQTPLTAIDLKDLPQRTRAEAIDELKKLADGYETASGQRVLVSPNATRKAFSGGNVNDIKKSLAGELGKIIQNSVIYGTAGDFDYAVAHLRLDGRDIAARLILRKAPDKASRLYQFEGFDLENTNPGAEAGIGEQTIAGYPDGDHLLGGLPAQQATVGDLVDIFNSQGPLDRPLFQGVNGSIRIREGARNTIKLMKTADASTFIHETGHDWLDRMLKDAKDPDAPATLKQDSDTVLKWLGADSPDAVKTRHHEKFARGFETYMMEGRAPSAALARVFAKFKTWLTTIYKTVAALKAPISDDIRGVFDRMLAEQPQRTVIAPEPEVQGGMAARHEALAESTGAERAHDVANTIEAERDTQAAKTLVESPDNDTRLGNTGTEAQERAARGAQSARHADEAGSVGGEAEGAVGTGALGRGGSEASFEGAEPRKGQSERLNKAQTPLINFIASQGGLKASDELISDLRQAIGAKNHYVPGFGQLIRVPKQISAAAKKSGRLAAMSLDRAATAAVEQGLLPEGSGPRELIDAIEKEARGENLPLQARPEDEAEQAHAEHDFLETVNDAIKAHGGAELSDAERARVLELRKYEGLNDPAEIIERLALESDDEESGSLTGVPGWDVAAPGWELSDDGRAAPGEGAGIAEGQSGQSGGTAARTRGEATGQALDASTELPRSGTQLVDKAGNIRLDNLNVPEDVKAVIRETAEQLSPFAPAITRGVVKDAEVLKLADALGMTPEMLAKRKIGEAFNAEQLIAATKLLVQSASNVRELAAKVEGGTEADVLAFTQAAQRHHMIQEQVSGATAETGRALRALGYAKRMIGQTGDIRGLLQDVTGRTLYQTQRLAADIANLDTVAKISKHIRDTEQKGLFDWIQSLFINALISGPLTHAGYTAAGEMFALFRAVGETGAAAFVGQVRQVLGYGPAEHAHIAEMTHQLYGMYTGARNGTKASWQAWKANRVVLPAEVERQTTLPGITGQDVGIHQTIPNPTIAGRTIPIGTVLESPGRLVAALHSFNWTTFYSQSIAAQAFRQAMKEKLDDRAFATRVADLTQNPTEEMIKAASAEAQGGALMQKPDYESLTGRISRVTNWGIKLPDIPLGKDTTLPLGTLRPLKFIDPFVVISSNVQKTALGRGTPLELFRQSVRDDLSMKNGGMAFDITAGKILAGTTFMMAAGGLAAEGLLNNSGPSDPKQARAWQKVYGLPHGLRIGDMSFDVLRLGNLGLQMSIAADLYHVAHMVTSEDATNLAGELVHAFSQNILDESSMRGPAEILQAVEDHDRYGPAWVRNFASSMIPFSVGLGQIARQIDPYSRNARTLMDAIKAKIPFESETLTPRRDIWGEPIENRGWLGTYYQHVGQDPVDNALYQLHIYPALPGRRIRGVQLTDQQYDDYSRIGGRMMKMRLNALVNTPGFAVMPNSVKIEQIDNIVRSARESARSMILMQNPGIITKAKDAKLAKMKGEPATVH